MNDFLKNFSNDSYKKTKDAGASNDTVSRENSLMDKAVDETKEALENPHLEKQNFKSETKFETAAVREETRVYDDEKIKKRKKRIIIGSGVIVVSIALVFGVFHQINKVDVPSFVKGKSIEEVKVWAAKNHINLETSEAFSVKVDESNIISQSVSGGKTIQKKDTFKVVVSKGGDPEQHIELPDFTKMNLTKIESWKEKNKANNVKINTVYSETVEKSKVIKVEMKTEGVDEKNYRRKDKLEIEVSKGKEVFEKNITLPDFKNKSQAEVDAWAEKEGVKVEYTQVPHNTIMEGNIISQDIAPKTKVAKNDVVKMVVSKGKVSYVPSFYGNDETQAQIVAAKAEVQINVVQYYSNTVPAGSLISQSLAAGTEVTSETIVLVYSLGMPYVGNFDGQDYYSLVEEMNSMNGKGARLTYSVVEVESDLPKGQVVTSNYKAAFVPIGGQVVIYVSRGQ